MHTRQTLRKQLDDRLIRIVHQVRIIDQNHLLQ
jgi:uncharacterized protein HemY